MCTVGPGVIRNSFLPFRNNLNFCCALSFLISRQFSQTLCFAICILVQCQSLHSYLIGWVRAADRAVRLRHPTLQLQVRPAGPRSHTHNHGLVRPQALHRIWLKPCGAIPAPKRFPEEDQVYTALRKSTRRAFQIFRAALAPSVIMTLPPSTLFVADSRWMWGRRKRKTRNLWRRWRRRRRKSGPYCIQHRLFQSLHCPSRHLLQRRRTLTPTIGSLRLRATVTFAFTAPPIWKSRIFWLALMKPPPTAFAYNSDCIPMPFTSNMAAISREEYDRTNTLCDCRTTTCELSATTSIGECKSWVPVGS